MARRSSHYTTDHDRIREWVEERGGRPAAVRGTSRRGTGILRIDFPGYSGAGSLEEISWDDFFDKFDDQNLVFLYQDRTARGQKSNFNKLVRVSDEMIAEDAGEGETSGGSPRTASRARAAGGRSSGGRSSGRRTAGGRSSGGRAGTLRSSAQDERAGSRAGTRGRSSPRGSASERSAGPRRSGGGGRAGSRSRSGGRAGRSR